MDVWKGKNSVIRPLFMKGRETMTTAASKENVVMDKKEGCAFGTDKKTGEKKLSLSLEPSRLLRGRMETGADGGLQVSCPREGLDYLLYSGEEGIRLEEFAYLCLDPRVEENHSMCFQLAFHEKEYTEGEREREPEMRIIFGLLPGIRTLVPFDFEILKSQVIFPERTRGRLKMSIFGKPVRLCDIRQIRLQTAPGFEKFHFSLTGCFLTDTFPEYELPEQQLIDGLGQWTQKEWKGKMKDEAACTAFLKGLLKKAEEAGDAFPFPDWDEYGGYTGKSFPATGWFRLERENGRFWLVDPAGHAFLSAGLDCINPGVETRIGPMKDFVGRAVLEYAAELEAKETAVQTEAAEQTDPAAQPEAAEHPAGASKKKPASRPGRIARHRASDFYNFGVENLKRAFGEDWKQCWIRIMKYYLHSWGVNTIGNWSDRELIRNARMPYVIPMDSFSEEGFPHTKQYIFRDFPDVFSPEYEESAARYAKGLEEYAQDPCLIGYFMRNEPEWAFVYGLNIAEEMLANQAAVVSKEVFLTRMKEKYGDVEVLNRAWNTSLASFEEMGRGIYKAASLSAQAEADLKAFSEEMITRYVEIPARALRRVDGNHLNLGMRYAYITDKSLLCGSEYFDVFSINSYQLTPLEPVNLVSGWLDKPVMVGEFHQGALDVGLTAHGIRGVTTQAERGCAYRYYLEQGLTSPYFLGAHYFQLNDQSCLGRFDGENYQIGLVDVCMQEYVDMTEAMRACHGHMYRVALEEEKAWEREPEDIEPVHY